MCGYYIINFITNKSERKNKLINIGIVLFLIIYFGLNSLASFAVKTTGLNNEGLGNNWVYWKFVVGLNTDTCGGYNEEDIAYMIDDETAKEEIVNRLKSFTLSSVVEFASCKTKNLFSGGTLSWTFSNLEETEFNILCFAFNNSEFKEILTDMNKFLNTIIIALSVIGVYAIYKKYNNNNILIFVNILSLNFLVYLFIEVRERYAYLLQISLFIVAGIGIEYICDLKKNLKSAKK